MKGIELYLKASFTLLAVFLSVFTAKAQEQDSIKSKALEEVVVVAKRGWVEGDKVVFQPTKQEKRLSNSPVSLINSMNLPMFSQNRDKDKINTISGESVSIFINGNPVNAIDAKAFVTKNVKRVEYLDHPADPTFRGCDKVINIITTKFDTGGVTKIDIDQIFPGYGSYSVASKLEYKRMTYGLLLSGSYSRDHSDKNERTVKYNDIYFAGDYYDEISNSQYQNPYNRYDEAGIAVNARYDDGGKVNILHTASFQWKRDPGSGYGSEEFWDPTLFKGNYGSSVIYERSVSPQISGEYLFKPLNKFVLALRWSYIYGHTDRSSESVTGDMKPIYNVSEEDVNSFGFQIRPTYFLNDKFTLQLRLDGSIDWFSTNYSGTANTKSIMNRRDFQGSFRAYWTITQKLRIALSAGLMSANWKVGDLSEASVLPSYEIAVTWNPSDVLNLYGSFTTSIHSPSTSQTSPVMVKIGELMWRKGNPDLKGMSTYGPNIGANWMPSRWCAIGFNCGYSRINNFYVVTYTAATPELGGVIGSESSNSSLDEFTLTCNLNFNLLKNKLNIGVQPLFSYTKYYGITNNSLAHFGGYANVSYTLGNVGLSLSYGLPNKAIGAGGLHIRKTEQFLDFKATYGIGNFYCQIGLDGFLGKRQKITTEFNSRYYSFIENSYLWRRSVSITISYNFDYGKKISKSINIKSGNAVKTSVIK